VLVAPSLGALLWFVSAALHLAEPGCAAGVCALEHAGATACLDALLFASLLSALLASALTHGWWRHATAARVRPSPLAASDPVALRLRQVCARHPRLRSLRQRIVAVAGDSHPLCTRGLLRPVIEVDRRLIEQLDDGGLTAALLHEAAHHGALDPLRYLVASASLTINPCGFLLRGELRRWRAAREAVCDEWAVQRAADPLALADALVAAARLHRPLRGFAVGLGGSEHRLLRLRVHLLLDYASRPPGRPSAAPLWMALAAALSVTALPHVMGAWPLDLAHVALERALAAIGLL
jgi:Zn-dependent protease with chaperone function